MAEEQEVGKPGFAAGATELLWHMLNPFASPANPASLPNPASTILPSVAGRATVGQRPTLVPPPTEDAEAGIIPTDIANDISVIKQIYWDSQSEETQFVKLVNYLAGNSILTLRVGVGGLGQSIAQTFADAGMDQPEIRNLATPEGKEYVSNYLRANWQQVPDLVEAAAQYISQGYREYRGAIDEGGQGRIPPDYRDPETDPVDVQELSQVLQEFGSLNFGPDVPSLHDVGGAYGTDATDRRPLADIVHGALGKAINDYMARVVEPNQTLITGAGGLPDAEGLGSIGFITSFDGTPWGDVVSFGDLFSGGRIGHMNITRQFRNADPEVVEKFQREFVALGLMASPPVWGRLDFNPATGMDDTVQAAVAWQVGITQEALAMVDENAELTVDGTPYIDKALDRFIATRMAGENVLTNHSRTLKQNTIETARSRIKQYLEDTGRYMTEGMKAKITGDMEDILDEMSPKQQELAFGQGGNVYERSLAENLLKQFYGSENWGQALTFGMNNRDQDYFNYAARTGAVSQRELDLLRMGGVERGRYRRHWDGFDDMLHETEKDVAVASLLRFIGDDMDPETSGGLSNATQENMLNGLNTYMHTVGAKQHKDKRYSRGDLSNFAQNALMNATGGPNPVTTTLAQGAAEELGGGVGGFRYRNLINVLNRVRPSVDTLRMPNV